MCSEKRINHDHSRDEMEVSYIQGEQRAVDSEGSGCNDGVDQAHTMGTAELTHQSARLCTNALVCRDDGEGGHQGFENGFTVRIQCLGGVQLSGTDRSDDAAQSAMGNLIDVAGASIPRGSTGS